MKLRDERMHMTLIDPEEQPPAKAGDVAAKVYEAGTDAIMVGGSTPVPPEALDETIVAIKKAAPVPVILFPGGVHGLSNRADAVYFMSLLNSRNVRHVVREQKRATRLVRSSGLEPIAMGYVVVEPGMTVGQVGEADVVPRDRPLDAVEYGLVAQYFGMDLLYLEAGSGAPDPVPVEMVAAVAEAVDLPLVVGGGIRTAAAARSLARAGADVLVTGTIVEQPGGAERLRDIVAATKGP